MEIELDEISIVKDAGKDDEQAINEGNIKVVDVIVNSKARSKNRNKTVECRVCLGGMKSHNLKQHMKTPQYPSFR